MTIFDPGLQPERTELAWRRTALSIALGSLVAMRLFAAALGSAWWSIPGAVGVVVAAAVWIASRRRGVAVVARLARDGDRAALPGGVLPAVLVGAVSTAGLLAVAVICLHAAG